MKLHGSSSIYEVEDGIFFDVGVDDKIRRFFIPHEPDDTDRPIIMSIIERRLDGDVELASMPFSITAHTLSDDQHELIAITIQKRLDREERDSDDDD